MIAEAIVLVGDGCDAPWPTKRSCLQALLVKSAPASHYEDGKRVSPAKRCRQWPRRWERSSPLSAQFVYRPSHPLFSRVSPCGVYYTTATCGQATGGLFRCVPVQLHLVPLQLQRREHVGKGDLLMSAQTKSGAGGKISSGWSPQRIQDALLGAEMNSSRSDSRT